MNSQTNCTKCGVQLLQKNAQCVGYQVFCQKCYEEDNAAILSMLHIGQSSSESYDSGHATSSAFEDPKKHLSKTSVGNNCCSICGQLILNQQMIITFKGMSYHQSCFKCANCAGPFPRVVCTRNEKYYCESCDLNLFVKTCAVCSKPARDYKILDGKNYHQECLRCVKCNMPFGAKESLYQKNGKYHCDRCYCSHFGKNCKMCGLVISPINEYESTFKGHSFHKACLVCRECKLQFPPNSAIYTAKNNENYLYCLSCYDSAFALNCTSCNKRIPASRRSISSGDKSWHKECFKCKRCGNAGKPLSDFCLAGNDILCANGCK